MSMTRYEATELCAKYNIDVSKNFYTLSAAEIERVLCAANERKYRKPKQANGSRGRYFFCALQRALTPKNFSGFTTGMTKLDRFNRWLPI